MKPLALAGLVLSPVLLAQSGLESGLACRERPVVACQIPVAAREQAVHLLKLTRWSDFERLWSEFGLTYGTDAQAIEYRLLDHAAWLALEANRPEEFVKFGTASLSKFPENPKLQLKLANVFLERRQYRTALKHAVNAAVAAHRATSSNTEMELQRIPSNVIPQAAAYAALALDRMESADPRRHIRFKQEYPVEVNICAKLHLMLIELLDEFGAGTVRSEFKKLPSVVWQSPHFLLMLNPGGRNGIPLDLLRESSGSQRAEEGFRTKLGSRMLSQFDAAIRRTPRSNEPFGGTEDCRKCHAARVEEWKTQPMSKMLRRATAEELASLGEGTIFKSGDEDLVALTGSSDGKSKYQTILKKPGGISNYKIDWLIGGRKLLAFGTMDEQRRIWVLPAQYSVARGMWRTYGDLSPEQEKRRILAFKPAPERTDPDLVTRVPEYGRECAPCHTTTVRAGANSPILENEPGIQCEACHGPSHRTGAPTDPIKPGQRHSFRPRSSADYSQVCETCHSHSTSFYDASFVSLTTSKYRRESLEKYDTGVFRRDGRFRLAVFIGEAMRRTACSQLGGANCGSCHQIHPANNAKGALNTDHRDGALLNKPVGEICTQCHGELQSESALRSHRQRYSKDTQSTASCIDCHMPRILSGPLGDGRSHEFSLPISDFRE